MSVLVRFHGIPEGTVVEELDGDIFTDARPTAHSFSRSNVRLLVPCVPSNVIGVGLNYASHRVHVEKLETASPGLFYARKVSSRCKHGTAQSFPFR